MHAYFFSASLVAISGSCGTFDWFVGEAVGARSCSLGSSPVIIESDDDVADVGAGGCGARGVPSSVASLIVLRCTACWMICSCTDVADND